MAQKNKWTKLAAKKEESLIKWRKAEAFNKLKWKIFWQLKLKEIGAVILAVIFFGITAPIVGEFSINVLNIQCGIEPNLHACNSLAADYIFGILFEVLIAVLIWAWIMINLSIADDKAKHKLGYRAY